MGYATIYNGKELYDIFINEDEDKLKVVIDNYNLNWLDYSPEEPEVSHPMGIG